MTGTNARGGRAIALTLAVIVATSAVTAVPGLVLFVQPVAADPPDTVAVAQGTNCYTVDSVGDGSQTVEEFYDYRTPETDPPSNTFSSFGTTEYQETSVSSMFVYAGSEGTSLVVVHDRTGDEDGGSTITWEISGLPADGELAVQDDYYSNGTQDDDFDYDDGDPTADIDWKYAPNRSDGAAFRGLESDDFDTIVIDPAYNEEADHWGNGDSDWGFSGEDQYRIDAWKLKEEGGDTVGEPLALDRTVYVHHDPCGSGAPPDAAIDDPGTVSTDETVTFDASGSVDQDDGDEITTYEWDFDGDGTVDETTTDATATHTYAEGGDYTASVTAYDTYANAGTAETTVTVDDGTNDPPTADLSAPESAAPGEQVTLDASGSSDDEGIVEYRWDVDDDGDFEEETTEPTTTTTYDTRGEQTVSVTVVDAENATATASATIVVETDQPPKASLTAPESATTGEEITFDASGSTDDRGIEEYRWDFDGDGNVEDTTQADENDFAYEAAGNYTATVTVVDTAGNTSTDSTEVAVTEPDSPPTASLSATSSVNVSETVTLNASASTDEDGSVEEYRWEFGDGETDTTENPIVDHSYEEAGDYEPTVTVVDDAGNEDTASATVSVENTNSPPTAALSAPETVTAGTEITFDASGSSDDEGIVEYRWEFGDGETDTTDEATIEHTYAENGTYDATVTVVDEDGETDDATVEVTVEDDEDEGENESLSAIIDASADEVAPGENVTFDAGGSTPADAIVDYTWTFGDGANGTGETVDHAYDSPGTYTVTLTVSVVDGATATATTEITVAEPDDGGDDGGNGDDGDNDDGGGGPPSDGGSPPSSGGGAPPSGGGGQSGGGQSNDAEEPEPDPQPAFDLSALNATTTELVAGEKATFSVAVANTGNASGNTTVAFSVNGTTLENQTVEVAPGERTTVRFSHRFDEAGTATVAVGDAAPVDVEVLPAEPDLQVTTLTTNADTVAENERVYVNATVRNDGHAVGSMDVELELFDEVVAVETVSVPPGETRTVSFTRQLSAPGSYTASVADRNVTIEVVDTADPTPRPSTTATTTPGFTAVGALFALLVAVVAAARRRDH